MQSTAEKTVCAAATILKPLFFPATSCCHYVPLGTRVAAIFANINLLLPLNILNLY